MYNADQEKGGKKIAADYRSSGTHTGGKAKELHRRSASKNSPAAPGRI